MGGQHRASAFVGIFEPILERYQETLARAGEVDFHDMINRATDHVSSGQYRSPYRYILVDEFQDISSGRAALVKALLDQSPDTRLFAVGDDWQAIYRFAGSDIAVMRQFADHFGAATRTDLETTFRCSEGVAAVATRFVLANPDQIPKTVRTLHDVDGAAICVGTGATEMTPLLDQALARIAADAETPDDKFSVLLLGRYRHLKPRGLDRFTTEYPTLRITYRTVHAAKGIEADYVVVLGVCAGKFGFPSEMTDDPLLDLVLSSPDGHPNAEERRLLYVAMTRARRRTFILEGGGPRSPFVAELLATPNRISVFGRPTDMDASCPVCKKGQLVRRKDPNSRTFFGCSNYPYCEHTEPACPACGTGRPESEGGTVHCPACGQVIEQCARCDGWLTERTGKHSTFLGCTNYPNCNYTRDLRRDTSSV